MAGEIPEMDGDGSAEGYQSPCGCFQEDEEGAFHFWFDGSGATDSAYDCAGGSSSGYKSRKSCKASKPDLVRPLSSQ